MDRNSTELSWSEEQWELVTKTVAQEASRARVAAGFLPLFGPLESNTIGVPSLALSYQHDPAGSYSGNGGRQRLCVDSEPNTLLTTISVTLALRSHEVTDPELSAALGMFRRAANVIGRVEDALIFHGQAEKGQLPPEGIAHLPPIFEVSGGRAQPGLASASTRLPAPTQPGGDKAALGGSGDAMVNCVVQSINQLEARGHLGPYACVLGHNLFAAVCTPTSSLVLPRDRILPFLEGPLVRSSSLPADQGLVVALGGNPIEIVVGSDISVRYLQMTPEPRYLFRMSERVALRVKEWSAVAVLDHRIRSLRVSDEPWVAPAPPVREAALVAVR